MFKIRILVMALAVSNHAFAVGIENVENKLDGPVKGGWYVIGKNVSSGEFREFKKKHKKLVVNDISTLTDGDFALSDIEELHLSGMLQLTDAALREMDHLEFLYLEECPGISAQSIAKLKSLKSLYLWNMQHFSDKDLINLRNRGVTVIDARARTYRNR